MTQTRRWAIGTAIVVVVILVAGWFLLAKPQKSKAASLRAQTASQQQANALLMTKISALQAEQKQLPQQQLILQKFSTEVPGDASEPTLIRQLSSAAVGAGVDLSTITPGTPTALSSSTATGAQSLGGSTAASPSAALYQLPLSLTVAGSYANIESFFSSLEHLPRALLVQAFTFTPGAAGQATTGSPANTLSASLTAAVFYAPGTAPIAIATPSAPSAATTASAPSASQVATAPAGAAATPAAGISRPANPTENFN